MTEGSTITLSKKDFISDQDVRWCPGCGDYAILSQVQKVFPTLGKIPWFIGHRMFKQVSVLFRHFWISLHPRAGSGTCYRGENCKP